MILKPQMQLPDWSDLNKCGRRREGRLSLSFPNNSIIHTGITFIKSFRLCTKTIKDLKHAYEEKELI